ncbi:MAG: class I SAM-dependent methyltransferase [Granulosicoccus sp.]
MNKEEIRRIKRVYEQRDIDSESHYAWLDFSYLYTIQERDRAIAKLWKKHGFTPGADTRALDVGGGSGKGARWLLDLGISAKNIVVNDLMPQRLDVARSTLPSAVHFHAGDATTLDFDAHSFDIVMQSVVFSSILDESVQSALADNMWRMVKPNGGILWYDFVVDNPSNKNVAGVKAKRVQQLFPKATIHSSKVTLAPPISRRACRVLPVLYPVLNSLPWLRTHRLCWITHKR